ncbi:MAG: DUF4976 domain-containing protein, partial [Candidatus Brocadiia bacterium]
GTASEALAQTADIMPTLLEAAGAEAPPGCEGRSLLPVMKDPSLKLREAALSEVHSGGRRIAMVCTRRYKYAAFEDGTGYMLHDLEQDPEETNNLIGHPDYRDVQEHMAALWQQESRIRV